MKSFTYKLKISFLAALSLLGLGSEVRAGHQVYPPTLVRDLMIFDDSENETRAVACREKNLHREKPEKCLTAYIMPRTISLAKTSEGIPMLTQGLFFSRKNIFNHRVVYNMTLTPEMVNSDESFSAASQIIAAKYQVYPEQVQLSPVRTGSMQFLVTSKFGSGDSDLISNPNLMSETTSSTEPKKGEAPATLKEKEIEKIAKSIAHTTSGTDYLVPRWLGNLHSLGALFSVSIRGSLYDLEPALQNMFLKKAGNAFVGTVSFKIPVKTSPINMQVRCNLRNFREVVNRTVKEWSIYRRTGLFSREERFSNNEWNTIRKNLDINTFCSIYKFEDISLGLTETEAFKSRIMVLFDRMFNQAFTRVGDFKHADSVDGRDPKYTLYESRATSEIKESIELDLREDLVVELSSDLDFQAGNITSDHLDPSHKYVCYSYERFDIAQQKCVMACDPLSEVYFKYHPKADSNGCVALDILDPRAANKSDQPVTTENK